jgi:hypothetical protein
MAQELGDGGEGLDCVCVKQLEALETEDGELFFSLQINVKSKKRPK